MHRSRYCCWTLRTDLLSVLELSLLALHRQYGAILRVRMLQHRLLQLGRTPYDCGDNHPRTFIATNNLKAHILPPYTCSHHIAIGDGGTTCTTFLNLQITRPAFHHLSSAATAYHITCNLN